MHWLYIGLLTFLFFAGVAMMIREGLWSNILSLFCILFSGVFAFAFYGPFATWIDEMLEGKYTYLLDFLSLWVVFCISMIVLRLLTGALSRVRVRFKMPVESFGAPIVAVVAAWLLVGFVAATFYAAPLAKDFLGDAIVVSDVSDVETTLMRPHIHWLRFAGRAIKVLSSEEAYEDLKKNMDVLAKMDEYNNYQDCEFPELWGRLFIVKYQLRRAQFDKSSSMLADRG